jgi:hypothetical protein
MIGNNVVDIFQKDDIPRKKLIQVGKERPMSAGSQDQPPRFVAERAVLQIDGNGVRGCTLDGNMDFKADVVLFFITLPDPGQMRFDVMPVVLGNGKVDFTDLLTIFCIKRCLHQMFFKGRAAALRVSVKLQQGLGK